MFVRPHHKQRFRQTCVDLGTQAPGPWEGSPAAPSDLVCEARGTGRAACLPGAPAALLPQPPSALAGWASGKCQAPLGLAPSCFQAPHCQRNPPGRPRARASPSLRRGRLGGRGLPASPPVPPAGRHSPSGVGLVGGAAGTIGSGGPAQAGLWRSRQPPCSGLGVSWLQGGGRGPLPVPLLRLPLLPGLLATAPPGRQPDPVDPALSPVDVACWALPHMAG